MKESCALRLTKRALVQHVTDNVSSHNKLNTEAQDNGKSECNSIDS